MIEIALQPVPELGFALQMMSAGGAAGLFVAYRARRHSFRVDAWLVTARWSLVGLGTGLLILLVDSL